MKQKTLKISGMGVPRIFIWLLGFMHGRILKTAILDEETGYICSSYVATKCKLFEEFAYNRVKQLEQELKAVRVEAFDIIGKESQIQKKLAEDIMEKEPSSINEKRDAKRCASRRASYKKMHEEHIKRLGEINAKIRACELNAKEELDATISAIQSRFGTYAHGMLCRPVKISFLPPIQYSHCFELYEKSHKEEDHQIHYILKEVLNYE